MLKYQQYQLEHAVYHYNQHITVEVSDVKCLVDACTAIVEVERVVVAKVREETNQAVFYYLLDVVDVVERFETGGVFQALKGNLVVLTGE